MARNNVQGKSMQSAYAQSSSQAPTATIPTIPYRKRAVATPTHSQIAERAKAIWRSKGCPAGQDERNWLEAEAQLKTEMASERLS